MKNEDTNSLFPGLLSEAPKGKIKVVSSINSKAVKPMYFSYSKLSLYEECSLKYKLKYIDKLPEEPKFYFALGNSVHNAMEFMYAVKSPPFPELKDVLKELKREWKMKNWMQKGYNNLDHEAKDYQKAVDMIEAYYEKHHKIFKVPFLLEYRTTVEVDGLKVIIIVDKINYLGNGEIEIIDYKTGKNVSRSTDQVYLYQKICEHDPRLKEKIHQIYGDRVSTLKVKNMEYYYVPGLREIKFERGQEADIQSLWDRVLKAADGIRAEEFKPNPGELQCKFCDYKAHCPIFTDNKNIITTEKEQINYDKDGAYSKLASLVDEYGKISTRINSFNKELENIKTEIAEVFEKKNIASYSGKNYSLNMKKIEKWHFKNRDAVIGLLKKKGLYDKVLAPVLKNIVDLLSDESITESVKKEIKAQGDKKEVLNFEIKNISEQV
ncbi:MAG: PD-(D/E)XK nuclease family protein [Elusimicrobiales bacterium]|nr:PD-(D/E)XK nuclease family protein [Elusimicrobiales bacterium]